MNRELIVRSTECKPCTAIGENLKSSFQANHFHPYLSCAEPNQEIQIDFDEQNYDEKSCFSKSSTAFIFDKADGLM